MDFIVQLLLLIVVLSNIEDPQVKVYIIFGMIGLAVTAYRTSPVEILIDLFIYSALVRFFDPVALIRLI